VAIRHLARCCSTYRLSSTVSTVRREVWQKKNGNTVLPDSGPLIVFSQLTYMYHACILLYSTHFKKKKSPAWLRASNCFTDSEICITHVYCFTRLTPQVLYMHILSCERNIFRICTHIVYDTVYVKLNFFSRGKCKDKISFSHFLHAPNEGIKVFGPA
jgi:hypothetical protein